MICRRLLLLSSVLLVGCRSGGESLNVPSSQVEVGSSSPEVTEASAPPGGFVRLVVPPPDESTRPLELPSTQPVPAILDDGRLLIGGEKPCSGEPFCAESSRPGAVACDGTEMLWSPSSGEANAIATAVDAPPGICSYYGDSDTDWIVWWGDQSSTELYNVPWYLYVSRRDGSETREVAHYASSKDGSPVPTPYLYPFIDHGWIVWAASDETPQANAYAAPADGSAPPTIIEPDSGWVTISYPFVYTMKRIELSTDATSDPTGPMYKYFIRVHNLVDGKSFDLPNTSIMTFFSNADSLFVQRDNFSLDVLAHDGTFKTNLNLDVGFIQAANSTTNGLAFSTESGSYLLQNEGGSWLLVELGGRPYANVVAAKRNWVYFLDAPDAEGRKGLTDKNHPDGPPAFPRWGTVETFVKLARDAAP